MVPNDVTSNSWCLSLENYSHRWGDRWPHFQGKGKWLCLHMIIKTATRKLCLLDSGPPVVRKLLPEDGYACVIEFGPHSNWSHETWPKEGLFWLPRGQVREARKLPVCAFRKALWSWLKEIILICLQVLRAMVHTISWFRNCMECATGVDFGVEWSRLCIRNENYITRLVIKTC